jgi:hypothetical protein
MSLWEHNCPRAQLVAFFMLSSALACGDPISAGDRPRRGVGQEDARGPGLQGACSLSDRTGHVHGPNQQFIGKVRGCSKETWADKAKNTACLTKALPALSQECAGCFADMASCALSNCKMACMLSSTSDGCTSCANTNCQASLVKCSGVAAADLP